MLISEQAETSFFVPIGVQSVVLILKKHFVKTFILIFVWVVPFIFIVGCELWVTDEKPVFHLQVGAVKKIIAFRSPNCKNWFACYTFWQLFWHFSNISFCFECDLDSTRHKIWNMKELRTYAKLITWSPFMEAQRKLIWQELWKANVWKEKFESDIGYEQVSQKNYTT